MSGFAKIHNEFLPDPLPTDPLIIAASWLKEAWDQRVQPNPNAMTVATVGAQNRPSVRIVLCKDIVADPGYALFYTNYNSRKGKEIGEHPRAAAVLFWDSMHRQLRIEGPIAKSPPEESDAYFASRPWQRRIGAWASQQSQPVESRAALLETVAKTAMQFGAPASAAEAGAVAGSAASRSPPATKPQGNGRRGSVDPVILSDEAGKDIPVERPPHWGGYRLWAESVELWVEGEYRIHDRARWTRPLRRVGEHMFEGGHWTATRLQP